MTSKERKEFLEILKKYQQKNFKKEDAQDFLVNAGIYTEKGNLKKRYKTLCIPQEQV
jgi:hypothetical protein